MFEISILDARFSVKWLKEGNRRNEAWQVALSYGLCMILEEIIRNNVEDFLAGKNY